MQHWQRCAAALLLTGAVSLTGIGVDTGLTASAAPAVNPGYPSETVHRDHGGPQQHRQGQHGRLLELTEQEPVRAQQELTRLQERLAQQQTRVQESIARLEAGKKAEESPAKKAVLAAHVDVMRARASMLEKKQVLVRKLLDLAAERAAGKTGR